MKREANVRVKDGQQMQISGGEIVTACISYIHIKTLGKNAQKLHKLRIHKIICLERVGNWMDGERDRKKNFWLFTKLFFILHFELI